MRDLVRDRLRPLLDRLGRDLAALAEERLEAELARIEHTFDVALSAYQSDGAPDLITKVLGPQVAEMLTPPREAKPAREEPKRRTIAESKSGRFAIVERDTKPANEIQKDRHGRVPATAATTVKGEARKGPPHHCVKCGEVGRRSDGCGITHNIGSGKERSSHGAAGPVRSAATPNRLATIAAVAKRLPEQARRPAAEPEENDTDRWSSARITEEMELAENRKLGGELPRARSSFRVTPPANGGKYDDVQELDFGDRG
jgi:hypothetical protein